MDGRAHIRDREPGRKRRILQAWLTAALALAVLALPLAPPRAQESSRAVIAPGEAAVTGFSGAPPPPEIAPGDDPAALTFIDLNGPSLRIVDLRHMGGPTAAQLVGAPKPFTFSAGQIGQVYGVALDDASPPNVYLAATSAYGLPIVASGLDGRPRHVKTGAPNAAFMPGLWGPHGGSGSIWKIDGATARASLFANVLTDNRPNAGAALGGVAFDARSKSLYVADRETGLIHRLALDSADLGVYDHGVAGRAAQGLPAVPWSGQQPIDVTSPQFDSADPATWNLAPPERRIFGLAVHDGRLYYAVADGLQIWSVGLKPDGSFGDDAVIELQVPPAAGPTEISRIAFDEQGRMLLAERPASTGAFDFDALSIPAIGRALRYAIVGTAAGRRVWQEKPDEFALGFPGDDRNGDGGVDAGYNYDHNGDIIPASCGGFVWMTGEDLRQSADATLAAKLAETGPLPVAGLEGVGAWQTRPRNVPPLESYFVSYADGPPDESARGHMGDIAILRGCAPATHAGVPPALVPPPAPPAGAQPPVPPPAAPPGGPPPPPLTPPHVRTPPPPPPGSCPPDQVRRIPGGECGPSCRRPDIQIGGRCCPVATLAANGECSNSQCQPGRTAIGPSNFCCASNEVYSGPGGAPACCSGPVVNGRCAPPQPPTCPPGGPPTVACPCPSGYVQTGGACCLASKATSKGVCCPAGEAPGGPNNNECLPILHIPHGPLCCASGLIPTQSGACCAPANVTTTGVCCTAPVNPSNRAECPAPTQSLPVCAPGYVALPDGKCCLSRLVSSDGRSCLSERPSCGAGEFRNAHGVCERLAPPVVAPPVVTPPSCRAGEALTREGRCAPVRPAPPCSRGEERMPNGLCAPPAPPPCPRGEERLPSGACAAPAPLPCPRGQQRLPNGACAVRGAPACPPGLMRTPRGLCVPAPCPPGLIRNRQGLCIRLGAPGIFPPMGPGEFAPPRGQGFPGPGGRFPGGGAPGFGPGGGNLRQP